MRLNITIEMDSEELADGQTVGSELNRIFGGNVSVNVGGAPEAKRQAQVDTLAQIDTSEEDDALDAEPERSGPTLEETGDWSQPPEIPPSTATAAPPADSSAPTPAAAAAVVVPPGPAGVAVDSAGVPWNAAIHNGNKQKYGKGSGSAKEGRWMWKRGTKDPEREETAQQLAADLKSAAAPVAAPAVVSPPAATPVVTPVVGAVAATTSPVPTPENAAPAAAVAPVVPATTPTVSATGWTWANFLEAMTATGTGADVILAQAAQYGITTIPELSPRVDVLEAVATALGWSAPGAAV